VRRLPEVEELRAVYGEAYFRNSRSEEMGYEDYERDRYCIVKTAGRRLDLIERYQQERGRLLDVGCALGFFLEAAQHRGWQVDGVDISAHATEYAKTELGIPARCGQLEEVGFEPESYDLLTLWDVIEHVPDPVAHLRYCRSLLRDSGVVVISTPDIGSLVARATRERWMGFKLAEEHLYYFNRQTLSLALDRAGFEVLHLQAIGKDVSLDFFTRRLGLYAPRVASALARGIEMTGLGRASVYVNPRDIVMALARKREIEVPSAE
jgi:2-polyprenyl-3-methyl-5-hydroxy-6-metoxy-1,4-benzoquinol methylase